MKAIQLARFPKIKHAQDNWCIPAAIENVVRYHGGDLSQQQIVAWIKEVSGSSEHIDIENVVGVLRKENGHGGFIYRTEQLSSQKKSMDTAAFFALVRAAITQNLPPIVVMEFPSCWYLPGYSAGCEHYVLTIIGITQNHVLIWDTNPAVMALPIVVSNEWILSHLSPATTMLWVIPCEKEERFHMLLTGEQEEP